MQAEKDANAKPMSEQTIPERRSLGLPRSQLRVPHATHAARPPRITPTKTRSKIGPIAPILWVQKSVLDITKVFDFLAAVVVVLLCR
jgi:hypothetical protein